MNIQKTALHTARQFFSLSKNYIIRLPFEGELSDVRYERMTER